MELCVVIASFFFFQAEDGIRDLTVTGVQTCALPIFMTITSTYDHRIIQGAESGNFLRRLDGLLQGDDKFYDEVFESLRVPGGGMRDAGGVVVAEPTHPPSRISHPDDLRHVAPAMALVKAIRNFRHLAARLDPLGSEPPGDPALDPGPPGLAPELMG